ncbi:unnamed protein product [[Actinomadura] parvosata subsp. kistnae]|uniref:hypothetical protein n=1 Tax=[Actinomadura] parvosata TaxID=1955412 RepID=UPI000D2BC7D3|nr:hypothetical protein [Nonomuraea sp. ATCC 55076]SPL96854.1 unnamed protein product [Actinomadura parvosata subsp. kistnae]
MAGGSTIQEEKTPENGAKKRGSAVRATIGTVLAAILGLVSSFGVAGLGLDVYGPALTWVIIGWALLGMVIVGLWPLLRDLRRTRPRLALAGGAFAALAALSVWVVVLGRPGDGIDPIAHGCRYLNGTHQISASADIARSWGIIGNFTLVHNPHPKCGVVWAQFLTPKDEEMKRPPFRDMRIASIALDIIRRSPEGRQTAVWNYDTAPVSEVGNRDIWTPGLRLDDGVYEADLSIRFTSGEPANVHLTWNTDQPSVIRPEAG